MRLTFKKWHKAIFPALLLCASQSFSQQRMCDQELVCISPAGTVIAEHSQPLKFEMINRGPDVLVGTDTTLYMLYIILDGEQSVIYPLGVLVGNNASDTVHVGESRDYTYNGITFPFPDITEPVTLDFCVKIGSWGGTPDGDTVRYAHHDPNPDNDFCCKKVTVMPDKSSSVYNAATVDNGLQLYPNPANNMLFINNEDWATDKIQQITISDITGRAILERQYNDSEVNTRTISVSVATFPEGMYNVRVQTRKTVKNKKVVIRR